MTYSKKELTAVQALESAHRISFMPFVFQTAVCLKNMGIFSALDKASSSGLTKEQIREGCDLSEYAVSLLLDCGLEFGLIEEREKYFKNSKIGYFLLHDPLVSVNLDFTQNLCYKGIWHLEEALRLGKPMGLKELGFSTNDTIYPHLVELKPKEQQSWFAFDHKYSDIVFQKCLGFLSKYHPRKIVDVGGNTGKFALAACAFSEDISVCILDLPQQCKVVEGKVKNLGLAKRITTYPLSILSDFNLDGVEGDVWWMSQFLDCFSAEQVVSILEKFHPYIKQDAVLAIVEPCTGNQTFKVANECLSAFSLYFTAMANGNSRFYSKKDIEALIQKGGFAIEACHENIGAGHTLFVCRRRGN